MHAFPVCMHASQRPMTAESRNMQPMAGTREQAGRVRVRVRVSRRGAAFKCHARVVSAPDLVVPEEPENLLGWRSGPLQGSEAAQLRYGGWLAG